MCLANSDTQHDVVVFEAFEAAPRSEDVLAAEGALEWDFPGSSVAIPIETYLEPNFQLNLARFLEQASREPVSRFAPFTRKAGQNIVEERQTADPNLITHCFITLVEALGQHVSEIPRIRKRVRDDVCWSDGAKFPFRRLPLWLVLRVGLRRYFHLLFGDEAGRVHYKFFIASILSGLLGDVLRQSYFDFQRMAFLNAKLSRRLSKLEDDRTNASMPLRDTHEKLFHMLGPSFLKLMKEADARVQEPWENFKKSTLRPIPRLPRKIFGRLFGQDPFYLTLPNSGLYLRGVVTGQALWQSQQSRQQSEHDFPFFP
jgi:hypothetical protein